MAKRFCAALSSSYDSFLFQEPTKGSSDFITDEIQSSSTNVRIVAVHCARVVSRSNSDDFGYRSDGAPGGGANEERVHDVVVEERERIGGWGDYEGEFS